MHKKHDCDLVFTFLLNQTTHFVVTNVEWSARAALPTARLGYPHVGPSSEKPCPHANSSLHSLCRECRAQQ